MVLNAVSALFLSLCNKEEERRGREEEEETYRSQGWKRKERTEEKVRKKKGRIEKTEKNTGGRNKKTKKRRKKKMRREGRRSSKRKRRRNDMGRNKWRREKEREKSENEKQSPSCWKLWLVGWFSNWGNKVGITAISQSCVCISLKALPVLGGGLRRCPLQSSSFEECASNSSVSFLRGLLGPLISSAAPHWPPPAFSRAN